MGTRTLILVRHGQYHSDADHSRHGMLTPAGRELLGRLDGPVLDLHRSLLGHLSRAELAELSRLLVKARSRE